MDNQQIIFIESIHELRRWLEDHYEDASSVWLARWKKGFNDVYISYDELVDELICYGWVDSLPRSLDEEKTMLRISPRNPKSNWSRVNKERVERLTAEGRMKASGLKLVALAKSSGAWDFLEDVENLILPEDLEKALAANPIAAGNFERFPRSSKRNILEWIKSAKQESTRKKRIAETVTKAANNLKANHPKGRDNGPNE